MYTDVYELITTAENDYNTGQSKLSEFVDFSVKDNVNKIDAYLNSKHITGDEDALGREKPFFNIVTAAVNVWYRATDIDRSNIRIKGTKSSDHTIAMLANVKSKEWMRKSNFGVFLNDWGRTLAAYGSAVLKFVEKDGDLTAQVIPWNRLIVDSIEFEGNPVIEKYYLTPSQLRKNKSYDPEVVQSLLTSTQSRETLEGSQKDNKTNYIEIYEVHGELPSSWLEKEEGYIDEDDETYTQQVHICSFVQNKDGEMQNHTLYSGKERDPYMITHLIKQDGRVMGIGAVEHLFEAQWMVNHNEKNIKDVLDFVSKVVLQTADPNYQGQNSYALDTGTILYHEPNAPITKLDNSSSEIVSLMNSKQSWQTLGSDITSTPDAIKGNNMPSGTAARQVEALQQESHSLFELMTENKGLDIEAMWRRFVIPHIKKQLDTKDEVVAVLDDYNIREIDQAYIPNEARRRENARIKKEMFALAAAPLDSDTPFPATSDLPNAEAAVTQELKPMGNQRYFSPSDSDDKTWKQAFEGFEWDCEVEVTNETHNKEATLTTLSTVFQQLASMQDFDNARLVLNKVLEETGVFSPMELSHTVNAPKPQLPQPVT